MPPIVFEPSNVPLRIVFCGVAKILAEDHKKADRAAELMNCDSCVLHCLELYFLKGQNCQDVLSFCLKVYQSRT